jgi:hypothetical protein
MRSRSVMSSGALAALTLALTVAACSKPETKTEDNPAAKDIADSGHGVVVVADAALPTVAAAAEPEEPLPTHAEEDTQAVQEIQKSNYKQELDRLAKEIENP